MQVRRVESFPTLDGLKKRYLEHTTAALDGMWLHGFVPTAAHYGLFEGEQLGGYLCVNDDGYVLQFFVEPRHWGREAETFERIVVRGESEAGAIAGVFVSTAEPRTLSLCLDHFRTFEVNALMYQRDESRRESAKAGSLALERLGPEHLPHAVASAVAAIEAPPEWVTDYYANLIERGELHGVWSEGRLIGTGENRRSDELQTEYADLGVIVAPAHRGQGLATSILATLAEANDRAGVKSICSTERGNLGAQKAIVRAGFVAGNRIVRFDG